MQNTSSEDNDQVEETTETVDSTEDQTEEYEEELQVQGDDTDAEENLDDVEEYSPGQKLQLVRVRFPGNARPHTFVVGTRNYAYGQRVVAMSDRGLSVGYVNSFPYEISYHPNMGQMRSIHRAATDDDLVQQREHLARERSADQMCKELIEKHQLEMTLTHVEFTQNGKKAVFYFNAPNRVDFRSLVKDLVAQLRIRVELRQISVRDRTAALGAIGVCGLQTCCSSFLKNYGSVSIKMAKNQNLALIPTKINGVCGQIKCCMKYEDAVYVEKKKILPKEGSIIQTLEGDRGKVYRVHILIEQFEMITDQGRKRRYSVNQYNPEVKPPEDYRFPKELPFIQDETHTVIGLEIAEQQAAQEFDLTNGESFFDDDSDGDGDNDEVIDNDPADDTAPEKHADDSSQSDPNRPKRRRGRRGGRNRRGGNNKNSNGGANNSGGQGT